MPLNLLKKYDELLDIRGMSDYQRKASLKGVFDRDFVESEQNTFSNKPIYPIEKEGVDKIENLFHHLTTVIVDKKSRKRLMDLERSERLHWIKHHFYSNKRMGCDVFSTKDKDGIRTYIYNDTKKYVIVLEPYRNRSAYYLLTAYHLSGRNKKKIRNKMKRKLNEII